MAVKDWWWMIDRAGDRPLWAAPALGRWAWAILENWKSIRKWKISKLHFPVHSTSSCWLEFMPCLPSVMDWNLAAWDKINHLLPESTQKQQQNENQRLHPTPHRRIGGELTVQPVLPPPHSFYLHHDTCLLRRASALQETFHKLVLESEIVYWEPVTEHHIRLSSTDSPWYEQKLTVRDIS